MFYDSIVVFTEVGDAVAYISPTMHYYPQTIRGPLLQLLAGFTGSYRGSS